MALVAVALSQIVGALPALVLAEVPGTSQHVARELGAFDLALAVGFLAAAWRPRWTPGLVPMALALAVGLGLTAVVDLAAGDVAARSEGQHLVTAAGVALLWSLQRAVRPVVPTVTTEAVADGPTLSRG